MNHLEKALTDRRNKNIALTGRYGSGKSSVLDQFLGKVGNPAGSARDTQKKRDGLKRRDPQKQQTPHKTLRISISTLGPDDDDDITNRIQKELVKQLLYRAKPGEILRSRFARPPELTPKRRVIESILAATALVCGLWLLGIRPDITLSGTDGIWGPVASVGTLFLLVAGGVWVARGHIGRSRISQISAGGTTISIDEQTESYFDKYLDEIVAFFDATETDLVVFEDLDRFEDPRIFESLRELNTLINASAKWKERARPLRFIYAIKDSVFEKLGEERADHGNETTTPTEAPPQEGDSAESRPSLPKQVRRKRHDATRAAVERANRTKFFELVIPVVPFLSHSNARDLLMTTLEELKLPEDTKIDRKLIDLVARHTTDMRLMINICNEFVVFAEKLLWVEERAPGVSAEALFSIVAYKNFHPADFEALPHRRSALDTLERKRRDVVHQEISDLHQEKANLLDHDRIYSERETAAHNLGDRLASWVSLMGQTIQRINVGDNSYSAEAIRTLRFWRHVSNTQALEIHLSLVRPNRTPVSQLRQHDLSIWFPESLDSRFWNKPSDDVDKERSTIDSEIAELQGADFKLLAERVDCTSKNTSFAQTAKNALTSDLARDLVFHGFLTRYYAEYSSVFYGNFVGVDVANFFRNCVWPNEMDIHFEFRHTEALTNLMDEAPEDFASSRSVLNLDVVNYLLEHDPSKAETVADFLVSSAGTDGMTFLDVFLKDEDSQKTTIVRHLAQQPWRGLFKHIAHPDAVVDEGTRVELLDAALLAARNVEAYEFDQAVEDFLTAQYENLASFTEDQDEDQAAVIYGFALQSGLIVPSLRSLSPQMLERFVADAAYELAADNLRCALGLQTDTPIALDSIRQDDRVWQQCLVGIDDYLQAVSEDEHTTCAVLSADTLIDVIQEQQENWIDDKLAKIIKSSSKRAEITDITDVNEAAWPALIRGRRMTPSAWNVLACTGDTGIDADLAGFLEKVRHLRNVDELEDAAKLQLALRLLNSASLTPPKAVDFVKQLGFSRIDVSALEPLQNDLLAHLLEAHLVPDERATFNHFIRGAGWPGVARAFEVSQNANKFLDPDLVSGVVADLLEGPTALDALKRIVVDRLEEYITGEDDRALRAAGIFARLAEIKLPLDQIAHIAGAEPDPKVVEWQLDKKRTSLPTDDLLRVLAKLGGNYSGFGEAGGHEFSVPTSPEMHRLLSTLEKAERVTTETTVKGYRPVRIVGS